MRTFTKLAIIATFALIPAAAQAATECKPAVQAIGLTDSGAWDSWRASVTSQYGAAWADLGLAQNKSLDSVNLALAVEYFASAAPCRLVRVSSVLLNNVGAVGTFQVDPGPKPTKVFNTNKLSAFGK